MGWTVLPRPDKPLAYMDRVFTGPGLTVLRSALVGFTYYAAVQHSDGSVFAGVALLRYCRDGQFGYKDMDESMGPNEARCPKSILALLTPTDRPYAIEWRDRCERYHAQRAAQPRGGRRRYLRVSSSPSAVPSPAMQPLTGKDA
jgi:hypothetical protein